MTSTLSTMSALENTSSGARSFYDDPLFSDVKITFSGQSFNGHKTILCKMSKFFEKALTGSFKEAQSGVVELGEDDDPQHVQAMLRYIYGLPVKEQGRPCSAEFLAHLFAMGDKYDVSDLRETTMNKLHSLIKRTDCNDSATLDAIRYIFTRQWADRTLFDRALYFCAQNMEELIEDERFTTLLGEVPGICAKLMVDVFKNLGEDADKDMIKCSECSLIAEQTFEVSCSCAEGPCAEDAEDGSLGRYWSRRRAGNTFCAYGGDIGRI